MRATQPATTFGPDEKDDDDDDDDDDESVVLLLLIDDELDDVLAFGFDLAT